VVHSGNYAALVTNRTGTYMGIAQKLAGVLQNGQTYNVSAWVQLAGGTNQTMQLTFQQEDGNGVNYFPVNDATVSTNGWTQIAGQFTFNYSGTLTSLVLYAEMPSSATTAYFIDDASVTEAAVAVTNGQCVLDWTNVFQRIDGFGASSAWNGSITPAQANMFFSTNTGVGLSFLRSRIAPDGTTVESNIMQMAQTFGARVWSSPWSPPAALKGTNANGVISVDGGPLIGNTANYQFYASQLAGYVAKMKNNYKVNIYAVSVQNEPDTDSTGYESCTWTAQQFHDFIPYLSAALSASNVASTKILFPESFTWAGHLYFQQTAMNDPAVAPLVGIIADHNYDGVNFDTGDMNPPAAIVGNGGFHRQRF
jgi:O-glycosyl hydrolase